MHSITLSIAAERERHIKATAALVQCGRADGLDIEPFAYRDYLNAVMDASSALQAAFERAAEKQAEDLAFEGDGFPRRVSASRRDYIAYRGL